MLHFIHPPKISELWESFVHLWYPELCVACRRDMPAPDSCFCVPCTLKLMPFPLDSPQQNAFTERMWGRAPLEWGVAAYHFSQRSPVQKALHQLKYHNQPDIGVKMGRLLGARLLGAVNALPDAIIPVPLHPKKERLRGYNQSYMFAQGLSEALHIPVFSRTLLRTVFTDTQTNKKRMERFDNVQSVFTIQNPERLRGKHLLLVDDVLTTGATLEHCAQALLKVSDIRLSMATIAIADL